MNDHLATTMISPNHFQHPQVQELARLLSKFDREQTLAKIGGLLTIPSLQGNAYRLELLAQLIVCACAGRTVPDCAVIEGWLNDYLGHVAWAEDPPEDVFVSNVVTAEGDFRVTTGMWEVSDFATSLLIQTLEGSGGDEQLEWLGPAYALLALSEELLQRAQLPRWELQPATPKDRIQLQDIDEILSSSDWDRRVVFETSQLGTLGIQPELLEPFVFDLASAAALSSQNNQESELHRRPLVRDGSRLVVSMPSALTYAARRYIVQRAAERNQLGHLEDVLRREIAERADKLMRSGSSHPIDAVSLPDVLAVVPDLCQSFVYRVGGRRFIHLLLLHESLDSFARNGLLELYEFSSEQTLAIDRHVAQLRNHVELHEDVDSGHTLVLFGNLGQGFSTTPPTTRDRWTHEFCRLQDLTLLLRASDSSLDKLILLFNQEAELTAQGIAILNFSGLLNLHSYWTQQGFHLLAPEMPGDQPGGISLATDFLTTFRRDQRRSHDEHCQQDIRGQAEIVQRFNSRAIYPVLESLPTYFSPSAVSHGLLRCCIELEAAVVWITFLTNSSDPHVRHVCFKLWEGMQLLGYRTVVSLSQPPTDNSPIEVLIDLRAVVNIQSAQADTSMGDSLSLSLHKKFPLARIKAAPAFLRHFAGVENRGEQLLVAYFVNAVRMLWGFDSLDFDQSIQAARQILGSLDAKLIHGFQKYYEIDYLLDSHSRPLFRRPKEHVGSWMRTALAEPDQGNERKTLDQMQSRDILNRGVGRFAQRLIAKLGRFDRNLLICELLSAHETLLRDRRRWSSSARAIRALYGTEDATTAAHKLEQERAESTLTLRTIVEAAVCSCPPSGGVPPDGYSVDELYGLACALISVGRDSEIVHFGLASEGITIHPSGAYSFSADILEAVGGPYVVDSFGEKFASAAADYEEWAGVTRPSESAQLPEKFTTEEFRGAFLAEYSLSIETLIEIVGALTDCCVLREEVVVAISHDDLLTAVAKREVSSSDLDAFLASFSLRPRPTWLPTQPVRPMDVEPWRFERRLSVMLRPVIDCGEEVVNRYVFGAATLRDSMGYVLESITNGLFDTGVFTSKEMRSYVGGRIEALGNSFTDTIAADLTTLGWATKTHVKMTQLGASRNPNLGVAPLSWTGSFLNSHCLSCQ